jgi:hypothetical protein
MLDANSYHNLSGSGEPPRRQSLLPLASVAGLFFKLYLAPSPMCMSKKSAAVSRGRFSALARLSALPAAAVLMVITSAMLPLAVRMELNKIVKDAASESQSHQLLEIVNFASGVHSSANAVH